MKKPKAEKDTLRDEYQATDFLDDLAPGKYAARVKTASNIAVLEPELVSVFQNSEAVNDALRAILKVAKHVTVRP